MRDQVHLQLQPAEVRSRGRTDLHRTVPGDQEELPGRDHRHPGSAGFSPFRGSRAGYQARVRTDHVGDRRRVGAGSRGGGPARRPGGTVEALILECVNMCGPGNGGEAGERRIRRRRPSRPARPRDRRIPRRSSEAAEPKAVSRAHSSPLPPRARCIRFPWSTR